MESTGKQVNIPERPAPDRLTKISEAKHDPHRTNER